MELIIVAVLAFVINVPLGRWRSQYKKFSVAWWLLIHASVPFIIGLRIWLDTPRMYTPLFIGLAVLGQYVGKKTYACVDNK